MSTVRAARRWIHLRSLRSDIDRRGVIVLACTSAALFAGFFALGRAATPGAAPSEQSSTSIVAESAGVAIPASLGSAPPIGLESVAPTRVPIRVAVTGPPAPAVSSAVTAAAPVQASVPTAPSGAVTEGSAPTVVASPPRTPAPAPAPAPAAKPAPSKAAAPSAPKGGSGGTGGSEKSQHGGGTSFDSSG
jgi:hypothetical protein